LPELAKFYEKHKADRDKFEVLALHDGTAKSLAQVDEKTKASKEKYWGGKDLPFPVVLLSAETIKEWEITGFPTKVLIDPQGNIRRGDPEKILAKALAKK
jgi:hypothetical protein